jgi:hypothetical protein
MCQALSISEILDGRRANRKRFRVQSRLRVSPKPVSGQFPDCRQSSNRSGRPLSKHFSMVVLVKSSVAVGVYAGYTSNCRVGAIDWEVEK